MCRLREASRAGLGRTRRRPGPATRLRAFGASIFAPAAEAHRDDERPLHKKDLTVVGLSKVLIVLPLKWLIDEHVWVEQWLLASEKLQALEQQYKSS